MDRGLGIGSSGVGVLRTAGCLACMLLLATPAAMADVERWRLDPERSRIGFELAALGMIAIRGWFEQFEGDVVRDPHDGRLRVSIRIDAGSLAMRSPNHRDWARSAEFFHVRRYPQITFVSEPLSAAAVAAGGRLDGVLELRGIAREVRFELAPTRCLDAPAPCEIQVTGTINRGQFGMQSRRMTLSSRVHLDMRVLAVPAPADETSDE